MHPHGLVYPPQLLDELPVLDPQPQTSVNLQQNATDNTTTPGPHPHPIRALSAKQFSDLHLQHTLAHPPDNALFPFLHGLEGDNHAQNTFFASSSFATAAGSGTGYTSSANHGRQHHHHHQQQHLDADGNPTHKITPRVPYHRGLVWVVCEEDLDRAGDYTTLKVLRRKPVNPPPAHLSESGGGTGKGEDDETQEIMDAACAPSSSESSEECSDGSSSYGDEDDEEEDVEIEEEELDLEMALDEDDEEEDVEIEEEELDLEMALDEDEQDMLLMLQAGNTAAAAAAVAKAKMAVNKAKSDINDKINNHNHNHNNNDDIKPASPDLDLDIDLGDDDDEEDSVLASPVQPTNGIGADTDMMDAVRVVVQGETEGDGDPSALSADGRLRSLSSASSVNMTKEKEKDESHFEGSHMHPVAARRNVSQPQSIVPITTTTKANASPVTPPADTDTDSGLPPPLPLPIPIHLPLSVSQGLGIDTSQSQTTQTQGVSHDQSQTSPILSALSSCSSSSASSGSSSISSSGSASGFDEMNSTSNSNTSLSSSLNITSPTTAVTTPSPLSQVHSCSSEQEKGEEGEDGEPLSLLELDLDRQGQGQDGELSSSSPEPESTASPPPSGSSSSLPSSAPHTPPTTTSTSTTASTTVKKPSSSQPQPQTRTPTKPKLTRPTDPACPPLLTSTFRPKELLRKRKVNFTSTTPVPALGDTNTGEEGEKEKRRLRLRVDTGTGSELGKEKEGRETEGGRQREGLVLDEEFEGRWEFVPARVPDGISLRNFGIQVPIYATLSDIVIYSPYGVTPATLALARRFRAAIRGKRAERLEAAGLGHSSSSSSSSLSNYPESHSYNPESHHHHHHHHEQDQQFQESEEDMEKRREEFLQYNVFVLDATEDELRKEVPHLMMRVCGAGVPGGSSNALSASAAAASSGVNSTAKASGETSRALVDMGAHTDGPDGHVVEQERMRWLERDEKLKKSRENEVGMGMDMDMDMDVVGEMDVDAMDVDEVKVADDHNSSKKQDGSKEVDTADDLHLILNTVDFALREREEMRDLTKASEIISLPPIVPSVPGSVSSVSNPPHTAPTARQPIPMSTDADTDLAGPVWDPRVGQVYLGNSGDVPLAPDVPSHFRHAASAASARARGGGSSSSEQEEEEERAKWDWKNATRHLIGVDGLMHEVDFGVDGQLEEVQEENDDNLSSNRTPSLAEDDPFNYLATNDPVYGFGYDICVECHDLAPFPSAAHLRAAEEHLGMLDVMWRERWERAWAERVIRLAQVAADKGMSEEEQRRIRSCVPPPTPPRPPPHANAVIHLPFPSSPPNTQATMVSLMPIVRFLEKWIQPLPVPMITPPPPPPPTLTPLASNSTTASTASSTSSRRWSSVSALMPSFPSFPGMGSSSSGNDNNSATNPAPTPPPNAPLPAHPARTRSMTSPSTSSIPIHPPTPVQARSRPLKILLYSSDGYTESSVPALCLLMAIKSLMLPEAYLELQVEKRRSFFVYQSDLGVLRRVEGRLKEEREREKEKERERERERERMAVGVYLSSSSSSTAGGSINANGKRTAGGPAVVPARGGYWSSAGNLMTSGSSTPPSSSSGFMGRPAAKSVSFAHAPGYMASTPSASHYSQQQQQQPQHQTSISSASMLTDNQSPVNAMLSQQIASATQYTQKPQFEFGSLPATSASVFTTQQPQPQAPMTSVIKGRPRASTSPWLPSLFGGDHQSWFNDPRFDGSFPSRVLPFLYLGNLNHASNVYMLHALGITHVVSVGECALVPPPHHMSINGGNTSAACHRPGPGAHFVPGKGPGGHGSLWIEEREGRIKVLDIKGVCDDGIDTLEPQLEPICDWIDKARQEGGQVLVHCRVGVSRSATVTIAYVMKHLSLPLVDAYLIVRSRRLSVLIQPNMRLLYNLCGWEIKLAKERAGEDERKLKRELARTLTWPYLSKEVHALNEKYLH